MDNLIGRIVEVSANNITYTGKLVEISETEVYLEGESGWIVIPLEQVAAIRAKETD
jgi:hypothetical protein